MDSSRLELLNKALSYPSHCIPIAAHWKRLGIGNGEIGLIMNSLEFPMSIRFNTSLQSNERPVVSLESRGYELPFGRDPRFEYDQRWLVTHNEEFVSAFMRMNCYMFPPAGVIMTVIVDGITEKPRMTLGAGMPILIEAKQLDETSWFFDFTNDQWIIESWPGKQPMKILDSLQTANICVHYSQPGKEQIRIITRKVHLVLR